MPNWQKYRGSAQFPEPQVQAGSGLTFAWAFMTRDGHTGNWGGAGQTVVEKIIVFHGDYVNMVVQPQLCGFVQSGLGIFNRTLPWQHPIFDWLWIDREHGIANAKPIGQPMTINQNLGAYPVFPYVELTLAFSERPYSVTTGFPTINEGIKGQPFLQQLSQGTNEFIQLENGAYQFDPGDAGVQATGLKGVSFKSGLALPYEKNTLAWRWYDVPHNWAFNAQGVESSILTCLNKVNSQTCFGWPPGTLYFDQYSKERKSYPIEPVGGDITTTWSWDFTFIIKHRDPPLWPQGNMAQATGPANKQGHNVAPMPQAGPNGFWFPILSVPLGANAGNNATNQLQAFANQLPNTGGAPRFQSADFGQIFQQAF